MKRKVTIAVMKINLLGWDDSCLYLVPENELA